MHFFLHWILSCSWYCESVQAWLVHGGIKLQGGKCVSLCSQSCGDAQVQPLGSSFVTLDVWPWATAYLRQTKSWMLRVTRWQTLSTPACPTFNSLKGLCPRHFTINICILLFWGSSRVDGLNRLSKWSIKRLASSAVNNCNYEILKWISISLTLTHT